MGRELRRVPIGWEHPKDENGRYMPMIDDSYEQAAEKWTKNFIDFINESGENYESIKGFSFDYYWEWEMPPDVEKCRPAFNDDPICYQIYETVSEGTPVSPVFETKQQIIEWLIDNGISEIAAKRFVETGWSLSGMFVD